MNSRDCHDSMVRPAHKSREAARRRAQKKLEALDYIPQAAKLLSEILITLAEKGPAYRNHTIGVFAEIMITKITWEVAPR